MKRSTIFPALITFSIFFLSSCSSGMKELWSIGTADGSHAEFALAEEGTDEYMHHDFCYEDQFFVVGHSDPKVDFCYILPGTTDRWAGTSCGTHGFMGCQTDILFALSKVREDARASVILDLAEVGEDGSTVKIRVNGQSTAAKVNGASSIQLNLEASDLIEGDNIVCISVLEGSWVTFDDVRFFGEGVSIAPKRNTRHLLKVRSEDYDLNGGRGCNTAGRLCDIPRTYETPADYVDTRLGTGHSRPMIAPGPWMPFSLVKLSPDNQNSGWMAGYQPHIESIGCMSHIHEWTMAGLGMMPTNGPLQIRQGAEDDPDGGYRSRIDKQSERAPLGYYGVKLTDTDILLEATATTRCSFQRYAYPSDKDGRLMVDFRIPAEYSYEIDGVCVRQTAPDRLEGWCSQISPDSSDGVRQDYVVNFVMEFDAPVKAAGHWVEEVVCEGAAFTADEPEYAGLYVEFDSKEHPVVQVRTGISYVSVENAAQNLSAEISEPFGWSFEAVVQNQKDVWNDILGRVEIQTDDLKEKVRFYTNLYRSMCRNMFSDINGQWRDADEKVQQLPDPANDAALGCDAFWNSFWNLNQVWNLVVPEWSSRWVRSELAEYDACGYLSKGPAGMEYIPVMEGEHEIPLIVAAWQMGIRDFDSAKALQAMKKMQTIPYTTVYGGFVGNNDIEPYLKYHYVPSDLGRFSNSMEYSYDDWTVGQFAKALGDTAAYREYNERGYWWKNAINPENGYAHLRDSHGVFDPSFDPFGSYHDYTESNGWQITFFVPQDPVALFEVIGREEGVERLNWGFEQSWPVRFNAPGDDFPHYPVVQGNQQSMQMAFLFNYAGRPDLTQKWARAILDRYYGYGISNAYLGDEDQGQMSSWFVMAALGLFQTDGGCSAEPFYEIVSPLYERSVIHLGGRYGRGEEFVIEAHGASAENKYVQKALLNGRELDSFKIPASEVLSGGKLELWMTSVPKTPLI